MEINFDVEELYAIHSLHYEVLKGDKAGISSIRMNDQYRIEFTVKQVSTDAARLQYATGSQRFVKFFLHYILNLRRYFLSLHSETVI